jgi:hypothetical protein
VVVGLQPPDGHAVRGEERDRALEKRGDGGGLLVAVQLAVGQTAVIVDRRVAVLPADLRALLLGGAVAVSGDLVAGTGEARKDGMCRVVVPA